MKLFLKRLGSRFVPLVFLSLVLCGCSVDYGEKIVVNGTEIYYELPVTKANAEKLGAHLVDTGFADGAEKSVKLTRNEDGVWHFHIVIQKEFQDDDEIARELTVNCLRISAVFDGDIVKCHICDDQLESIKEIEGKRGKLLKVDNTDFFYTDISDELMASLAELMKAEDFTSNDGITCHVSKPADHYQFRMVTQDSYVNDANFLKLAEEMATMMSAKVFDGATVEFHLCNDYIESKNFVSGKADSTDAAKVED